MQVKKWPAQQFMQDFKERMEDTHDNLSLFSQKWFQKIYLNPELNYLLLFVTPTLLKLLKELSTTITNSHSRLQAAKLSCIGSIMMKDLPRNG